MPSVDDLSGHPDLAGVGAAMRSTWAAEQHDASADAEEQWQHRQSFRDWLIDAMHTGDRIAVTVVEQRFTGTVDEVGDDILGLRRDLRPRRPAPAPRNSVATRIGRPPDERRAPG